MTNEQADKPSVHHLVLGLAGRLPDGILRLSALRDGGARRIKRATHGLWGEQDDQMSHATDVGIPLAALI